MQRLTRWPNWCQITRLIFEWKILLILPWFPLSLLLAPYRLPIDGPILDALIHCCVIEKEKGSGRPKERKKVILNVILKVILLFRPNRSLFYMSGRVGTVLYVKDGVFDLKFKKGKKLFGRDEHSRH
jgi:hypothetical protein